MTFQLKLISAKLFKDWHMLKASKTPLKSIYCNHMAQAMFWGRYIEDAIKAEENRLYVKQGYCPDFRLN